MADKKAIASGIWESTSTWEGGTLPGATDIVRANGFNIAIKSDVTAGEIRNDAGAGAVAGGQFTQFLPTIRTINADVYAGTVNCFVGYNFTINGDVYGGTSTNARGVQVTAHGTNIVNGDVYGGTATGANGIHSGYNGTEINGNSYGGSGSTAYGVKLDYGGTQNGNSYGVGNYYAVSGTYLRYGSKQIGNAFGADSADGTASLRCGSHISQGGILIGNATGGSAPTSYGARLEFGGIHIGTATGGTGTNARGSQVAQGSIFQGVAVSTASNFGVFGLYGSTLIIDSVTDGGASPVHSQHYNYIYVADAMIGDIEESGTPSIYNDEASRPFLDFGGGAGVYSPFQPPSVFGVQ